MCESISTPTGKSSVELMDIELNRIDTAKDDIGDSSETRASSVHLFSDPKTVGELLRLEGYYRTLPKSFVFIQNRKESSDDLVNTMMNIIGDLFEFRFFETHSVGLDTVLEKIENDTDSAQKPQVWVVDVTDVNENVNEFCTSVALVKQRQHGIWLRAYIRDLSPRIMSLFDALFAFDMSSSEYETLRTAITLPSEVVGELRDSSNELRGGGRVLFFLNYKRSPEAPLLEKNPTILLKIKEEPMDITPLVPIIVEATKFMFNEASQWLAVVRKRVYTERDSSDVTTEMQTDSQSLLPALDKRQFFSLQDDADALKAVIDRVAVESNAYRIRGLVEQIRIHRRNLTDYEQTEAEYGSLVPTHIRRAIERESEAILKKIQELQELLSSVYQKRVEI
jgi:hypothetical protein